MVITIKVQNGHDEPYEKTVEATIVGQLAWYPNINNSTLYTITHVKSGMAIASNIEKPHLKIALRKLSVIDFDAYADGEHMPKEHSKIWRDVLDSY